MSRVGGFVVSMLVACSALAGCAAHDQGDVDPPESIDETTPNLKRVQALPDGSVEISAGTCHNDGLVIEDGEKFRLRKRIGPDVTGMSVRDRAAFADAVCHNTRTWSVLVDYICAANTASGNDVDHVVGTFNGFIPATTEWLNRLPVQHPAFDAQDGFFFGHSVHPNRLDSSVFPGGDPCPGSAEADVPLGHIECCATAPAAAP